MMYVVYCRECSWEAPKPLELKGEANMIAGRHISNTGHSVALRELDPSDELTSDTGFHRSGRRRTPVEILRPIPPDVTPGEAEGPPTRQCGPVLCTVQRIVPVQP